MRHIFEDNHIFDLYMYTLLEEEGGPKTDDAVYYLLGKHIWDYLTHFKKGEKDKQAQANYRKKYGIDDDNPRDGLIRFAKHELYPIEDSKNEEGKRKTKRQYKWFDKATKTVICSVDTNKTDAKNAIKELYKTGEYKGDADLVITYDVVEGQAVVATAKYTPSKNTKSGKYIAFGIEA